MTVDLTREQVKRGPGIDADQPLSRQQELAFAAHYGTLLTPDGVLVLGGILDGEADDVEAALRATGWRRSDTVHCEGWSTLVVRR